MSALKRFTQSITVLLEFFLGAFFVYITVKVVVSTGLISWIDTLFEKSPILFWLFWLISRGGLGWVGFLFLRWYPTKLEKLGFFWHGPKDVNDDIRKVLIGDGKDLSFLYIIYTIVTVVFAWVTEICFMLVTLSEPIYFR